MSVYEQQVSDAKAKLQLVERIRDRVNTAMAVELDRDSPVAQGSRFLAVTQALLDEEVRERQGYVRSAEEALAKHVAEQSEAADQAHRR